MTRQHPYNIDLGGIYQKAKRAFKSHLGDITINLPIGSFQISAISLEVEIARELVIRLKDRRVMSSWQCCSSCTVDALRSLQEIRAFLVDAQVRLSNHQDSPLFSLIEVMNCGVRSFLTFEETIKQNCETRHFFSDQNGGISHESLSEYQSGLELLRWHLNRCLVEISKIAGMETSLGDYAKQYEKLWPEQVYRFQSDPELGSVLKED